MHDVQGISIHEYFMRTKEGHVGPVSLSTRRLHGYPFVCREIHLPALAGASPIESPVNMFPSSILLGLLSVCEVDGLLEADCSLISYFVKNTPITHLLSVSSLMHFVLAGIINATLISNFSPFFFFLLTKVKRRVYILNPL